MAGTNVSVGWARRGLAASLVGLALAGCATAPIDHAVTRSDTFAESKDVIWERAVAFFAERNLSIKTIDKASGIIAAERQLTAPTPNIEGFADCGSPPGLYRPVMQTVDLNLFVRALPQDRTSVTVNTRFVETRRWGQYPPNAQTCTSSGLLESSILGALGKQL